MGGQSAGSSLGVCCPVFCRREGFGKWGMAMRLRVLGAGCGCGLRLGRFLFSVMLPPLGALTGFAEDVEDVASNPMGDFGVFLVEVVVNPLAQWDGGGACFGFHPPCPPYVGGV